MISRQSLIKKLKRENKSTDSNYKHIEVVQDFRHKTYYYLKEEYGSTTAISSETWRHYHLPKSSDKVVLSSYHEGRNTIFLIREGAARLDLIPAERPIGIEKVKKINNKKIKITYAGIAGGGVSASIGRGLANGVKAIDIIQEGGGKKLGKGAILLPIRQHLIIGLDDTDTPTNGATFELIRQAAEVCFKSIKGIRITNISECNLFPVKEKTSNCFSHAVGFSYSGEAKDRNKIITKFKQVIRGNTLSKNSVMVVFDGFIIPKDIEIYGISAKTSRIQARSIPEKIIKKNNLEIFQMSPKKNNPAGNGIFGALASIGLFWKFKFCAAPPLEPVPDDAKYYPNFYDTNSLIKIYQH